CMRCLMVGCGYVGIALGKALIQRGHVVTGMRRPGSGEAVLKEAGIEPLVADVTRPEPLSALPLNYDWVVNTVSASGGGPGEYRSVYLDGNRHLLSWLGEGMP